MRRYNTQFDPQPEKTQRKRKPLPFYRVSLLLPFEAPEKRRTTFPGMLRRRSQTSWMLPAVCNLPLFSVLSIPGGASSSIGPCFSAECPVKYLCWALHKLWTSNLYAYIVFFVDCTLYCTVLHRFLPLPEDAAWRRRQAARPAAPRSMLRLRGNLYPSSAVRVKSSSMTWQNYSRPISKRDFYACPSAL